MDRQYSNAGANISGMGFTSSLTLLFIGLKLTDHIDWSWWWVLSPIWIPIALLIVGFFIFLAFDRR